MKQLLGPLGAKKDRDAGLYGAIQAEIAALDHEYAALGASVAAAPSPRSFSEQLALEKWVLASRERMRDLEMRRAELVAIAERRRDVLARSNGELEAVKRLIEAAKRKRR